MSGVGLVALIVGVFFLIGIAVGVIAVIAMSVSRTGRSARRNGDVSDDDGEGDGPWWPDSR